MDNYEEISDDDVVFLGTLESNIANACPEDSDQHVVPTTHTRTELPTSFSINDETLQYCMIGQSIVTVGATVEILPEGDETDNKFLYIKRINRDPSTISGITLQGEIFQRSAGLHIGQRNVNEVILIEDRLGSSLEDSQPIHTRFPITRLVLRHGNPLFRDLVVTSDAYPTYNVPSIGRHTRTEANELRQTGRLVCRTIMTSVRKQPTQKPFSGSLRWIRYSESDARFRLSIPSETHVDIDIVRAKNCRHVTYASGCSGCGGDTCGAKAAGCRLAFCWDRWLTACASNKRNHPDADVYCVDAWNALARIHHYRVDILHLSWPCQYFSCMKGGRASTDDDNNSAALLGTSAHIRQFKPLYITMENTSGLYAESHSNYLRTILADIFNEGYNVSWTITNFKEYGLAASRKRIIIFGSHKSVPMTSFPRVTHGPGSLTSPLRTIRQVLRQIPANATMHLNTVRPYRIPRAPTNPDCQANCLLTSGGEAHFSGLRPLSLRERACLQGFPIEYKFKGNKTEINKQIGNAVPPNVWAIFIRCIVNTLQQWRAGQIDDEGNPV